jgi:hypothetical protein
VTRETIEVGSVEVDKADFEEAYSEATDSSGNVVGFGANGNTIVASDGDEDTYAVVGNISDDEYDLVFLKDENLPDDITTDDFETYVNEEVMPVGGYVVRESEKSYADVKVAEWDDGHGHIIDTDLIAAVEHDDVSVEGVNDGWLLLSDSR